MIMYDFLFKMCLMVVGMDWRMKGLDGMEMEMFKWMKQSKKGLNMHWRMNGKEGAQNGFSGSIPATDGQPTVSIRLAVC